MTQREVSALYDELYVRGLIKTLHNEMKRLRPQIGRRTILAAFEIESYEKGNPTQRRVIDKAQIILSAAQMEAA